MSETVTHLTPEEYIARERQARFASEYIGGRLIPRQGSNRWHGLITVALMCEIDSLALNTACEVYACQMRVQIDPSAYVYPDVVVTCNPRFADAEWDTLLNPVVTMEVLSDSTEEYDRGEKLMLYRRIETLQEYVLLSQKQVLVEQYVRQGDFWHYTAIDDLGGSLVLASLGIEVPLRRIYEDVLPLLVPGESEANS